MANLNETYLLEKAQAGDWDAFEQLLLGLMDRLQGFAMHLLGWNHPAVEDIVQNTCIALFHNLARLDAQTLIPFVFRVVRNQAYDHLRKQHRFFSIDSQDDFDLNMASHFDTESDAQWRLLYVEVQTAINQLPELQRQTLLLYAEYDLSYAEIADVMSTQLGTVKSRLFHAKQTLRRLVSPEILDALDTSPTKKETPHD